MFAACLSLQSTLWANAHQTTSHSGNTDQYSQNSMAAEIKEIKQILDGLSRQVMLQQFYSQEKIRGEGNSGLQSVRLTQDGTRNYYESSHLNGPGYMAMHDHANYDRLLGLGELDVIMNGVKFMTRHNDYTIKMPSTTSQAYHATEKIPFPDVPPSVLNKTTVKDQIAEMQEYFKAFSRQQPSLRDYRPYFKPILCYLEGGWTKASKDIDEPFHSDRHHIDAKSWFNLMEKVQYSSYTGSKSHLENFAFLPTAIYKVKNGVPLYSQWNYRILCHPIKRDLPTRFLKPIDDLMMRFPRKFTFYRLIGDPGMRFIPDDKNQPHSTRGRSLLDKLMREIPGKNNYPAMIHDNSYDIIKDDIRFSNRTILNTGYYHRYYNTRRKDAMGSSQVHRGFSDSHMWVAQTTNPKIIDMEVSKCIKKKCKKWNSRYTYALPLEITYLTPLMNWNPYDLATNVDHNILRGQGKRNGGTTTNSAFNGTNPLVYFYQTPAEMFSNRRRSGSADTSRSGVGVLDKDGKVRIVSSSGTKARTQTIPGVGNVRLRYPILPLHEEGSMVWQELNALKDMTMKMNRYADLFIERPGSAVEADRTEGIVHFELNTVLIGGEHKHYFDITKEEMEELLGGRDITVYTSINNGHSHHLIIRYDRKIKKTRIYSCDGHGDHCWDGHGPFVYPIHV